MRTECTTSFGRLGRREIRVGFNGGSLSSDGGALLIREVEKRSAALKSFAECFRDHRRADLVQHTVEELVAQRVVALVLGYEDLNDHDTLRHDPLLAVAVGKRDPLAAKRRASEHGKALASSSTLGRLELATEAAANDRYKKIEFVEPEAQRFFVDQFLQALAREAEPPEEIVLDLDNSDLPLHGHQEGRFFHGYYREYCYLPLYLYCGDHLLAVRLQTADRDPARHAVEEVERVIGQIRERYPEVRVTVRGDSGFCRDALMCWCEANRVDFVLGVARNSRLEAQVTRQLEEARRKSQRTGVPQRVFKEFWYETVSGSWSRRRRVVAKAEHLPGDKANPRFVVTSISNRELGKQAVYEDLYCPRGEMENRIKEKQLDLFGTRVSAGTLRANQIRLYLSGVAYVLIQALRDLGLKGTSLERAQANTIRVRLLKVAARVKVSARKVWVSLASNWPFAVLFEEVREKLCEAPVVVM